LSVHAVFAGDGAKVALKEATVTGKALEAKASGSFDGTGEVALFNANVDIPKADLNAYLPPQKPKEKETAKAQVKEAKAPPTGWSEEPFEFAPLSKANGNALVTIGSVRYRDLVIQSGRMKASLSGGLLTTAIEDLKLADGTIAASAKIDASKLPAAVSYQAQVTGVQSRPLLKAFADNDRLSGKADFQASGEARGRSQKELVSSLNGEGRFKFVDGAIHGINLAATLRKAKTLGLSEAAGETEKTDFAELSGSFVIKNGVLENRDLKMLAPLVRLSGGGVVPLPPQTVDYRAEAKLVATLKGQTGEDALAGIPIPITVKGPWHDPSYGVDWKSVFQSAAKDPERLKSMPADLREAAKGLGVALPIPTQIPGADKLGDVIKSVPQLPIGTQTQEAPSTSPEPGAAATPVEQLKDLILPKTQPEPEQPTETPTTEAPAQEESPPTLDPMETLKGLFGQ
jgi:AsmA protein